MDENNKINELVNEDREELDVSTLEDDELSKIVKDKMDVIRRQNMLLGCQVICSTILQKIQVATKKPNKITYRDYERLIKDITNFCSTGLSRAINEDGTISPKEESEPQN